MYQLIDIVYYYLSKVASTNQYLLQIQTKKFILKLICKTACYDDEIDSVKNLNKVTYKITSLHIIFFY